MCPQRGISVESEDEPSCLPGLQVQDAPSEMCVSVHLCDAYLMNIGAFGQTESNQMLVVDEVHRTSCLHLAFKWEHGDFKPINLWTKGQIWTTVMSEQDEMLRV